MMFMKYLYMIVTLYLRLTSLAFAFRFAILENIVFYGYNNDNV